MNKNMKKTLALVGCVGAVACASARPIPSELQAARAAYSHATGSKGAELVLADMHMAKEALDAAEKAYRDNDDEERQYVTASLAYVAQRKAETAEALGSGALATKESAEGEKNISEAHAQASSIKEKELAAAQAELAKAREETKQALSQMSSLKDKMKQDSRGLVITLSGSVLFPSNKAELLPAARAQLSDIARILAKAKGQTIAVEGYTDSTGSKDRNDALSKDRAESVMNYLVDKGAPKDRIKAVGRGPESPIADNKSAEGRATNRRVEIVVQGEG